MQDFIIRKHKLDKKMMYLYRHPETGGLNPEVLSSASSLRDSHRSETAREGGKEGGKAKEPGPAKENERPEVTGAKENEYQKQMDMIKNKANNSIEAIRKDRKEKYELLK